MELWAKLWMELWVKPWEVLWVELWEQPWLEDQQDQAWAWDQVWTVVPWEIQVEPWAVLWEIQVEPWVVLWVEPWEAWVRLLEEHLVEAKVIQAEL